MRIYLASKSRARRELLKKLGFKFKVLDVEVKEKIGKGKLSYPQLVKHNARLKAVSAANKVKNGIII
ncbi:MAG: Maf family protein, partial [Candidatus Omnitrophota bacterium]